MKDIRFKTIKTLIDEGLILTWSDLFKYIPYTIVAKELKINNNRMKAINANTGPLNVDEIHILADLFGCEPEVIFRLAAGGRDTGKKKRGRGRPVKKKG